MKNVTSVNILGTKISILKYSLLLTIIKKYINKKSNFICVAAVHLVMEAYKDKNFQNKINKSLVTTSDGMPLVWIANLLINRSVKRVYGPDLMLKVCKLAEKNNYKVFLLGGAKNQGEKLKNNLLIKMPNLKIVGIEETPERPIPKTQNKRIIKRIKETKPDIIFVGLGCPLQEKWMIDNYFKFNKGIFIGIGAAFDFISKKVRQAPKFIQNIGLEWLFRLFQDPLRLWRRYLILNTKFVYLVIKNYKNFYEEKVTLP